MKNLFTIILNFTFGYLFAAFIVGCGSDGSQSVPQETRVKPVALTEEDLINARARCVDNNIAVLDVQRELCIQSILCEGNAQGCETKYQGFVQQVYNAWDNAHGSAYQEYMNCMTNGLSAGVLGEDYCKNEYFKTLNFKIGHCTTSGNFGFLCY